ncbi:MAG: HD domain-containing protein [Gemmobacter sp.]|jgi:putative hydrolase of HD superfamily|nr:HD domain-containing protein [Gemmobacter sp.]
MSDRLTRQFAFLNAADRLKSVNRANLLMDGSRAENTAEHSWHLALWALVMGDLMPEIDLARVVVLLLLHDLPRVDCGHRVHDPSGVAASERTAAQRLFDLAPPDLTVRLFALWQEFAAADTAEARFARRLSHAQPVFQVLMAAEPPPDHLAAERDGLATRQAARLRQEWPEIHAHACDLLEGRAPCRDLQARLAFLAEADRLKSVHRATTLVDGSRPENSAEHSWHLALYALVLADQAIPGVDPARVIAMLILHDLVEIDVGDVPIHSANGAAHASTETQAAEARAADRLFSLLPDRQGGHLRALWDEFEAAATPDAIFAKSLDRVQPVMANLMSGGGTWTTYNVTFAQLESRVGMKIARGAPQLWDWTRTQAAGFFAKG